MNGTDSGGGLPGEPRGATVEPRSVAAERGAEWYREGMAMFRQAPLAWMGLGAFTLVCQIALQAIPGFGSLLDKVLMPLVGAGLLVAAAAAERGRRPSLRHLLSVFVAPAGAQIAIIVAGIAAFAVEAFVVYALAEVNLLVPGDEARGAMTATVLFAAFGAGILASLPLVFVPFLALFGGRGPGAAFRDSAQAFAGNFFPLLIYGAIALALLAIGVSTLGIGLVVVFPLWATSSWASWRDIFR